MKIISLGTINLGNKVRISDPCYSMDVWCAGTVNNVLEGEYVCDAEIWTKEDTGGWGERVARLSAIRKDSVPEYWRDSDIDVGVDSGQCGIYDLDYFKQVQPSSKWYNKVCDTTDLRGGTIDDKCVVSSSGYGDGSYCCNIAFDNQNRIIGFEIVYLEEGYDEDEEEDD